MMTIKKLPTKKRRPAKAPKSQKHSGRRPVKPAALKRRKAAPRRKPAPEIQPGDIAERAQAEAALRQAEADLRLMMNSIPNYIWSATVDHDGTLAYHYNSPVVEKITGRPPEFFMSGRDQWLSTIHPQDHARVSQASDRVLSGRSDREEEEYRIVKPDGAVRWVRDSFTAINMDDGTRRLYGVVSDITQHRQADTFAREHAAELDIVHQASRSLTARLDLQDVLHGILEAALRFTRRAADACVFLYDADADHLTFGAVLRPDGSQTRHFEPRPKGLTYTVARHGQIIVVPDMVTHPLYADVRGGPGWTGGIIGIPLRMGQRVVGVMTVAYNEPHTFDGSEVRLLSLLADDAAIAIENARLYEAEREQREMAEALRDMGATLAASLDLDTVLDHLLDQIARVVPYDAGNVMLVDSATGTARISRHRGYEQFGEQTVRDVLALSFEIAAKPNLRQMVESKRPHVIADTAAEPYWISVSDAINVHSWIGAPIVDQNGEVVAFFSLHKAAVDFYQPKHAHSLEAYAGQAALALQNARLFEDSRRQTQELSALYNTAVVTNSVLDTEALLMRLYEQVQLLLVPDTFAVILYHAESDAVEAALVAENGEVLPRLESRIPLSDAGLTGWVVRERQPLLIGDLQTEPTPVPARHLTAPARSWLGVPLIARDRMIGVVSVQSFRPHVFGDSSRRLLESLSGQIAAALENARLFEAEHAAREQAEALREVAAVLNASLDREPLLQLILEQLARVVDYDSASLMLLSGDMLRIVAQRGFRSEEQQLSSLQIEALHHLHDTIKLRAPVIIPDTNANVHWVHVPGSEYIRCWMGVPLIAKDRVIGLLNLDKGQVGFYTESDASLAAAFAHQAVVAIENARLYQALAQDKRRLELLYTLGQDLSARLDPEQLYEAIHRAAAQLMPAEAFSIALLDKTQNDIEAVYLIDKGGRVPPARIPLNRGLSGRVIATGESILSGDIDENQNIAGIHFGDPEHVRSVLAVPMRLGEKVVGMLSAQSYQPDIYTPDDQQTLGTLAYQAAIAIENAKLFQITSHNAAEMRAAGDILRSLNFGQDVASAFPEIANGLKTLTGCDRVSVALLDDALETVTVVAADQDRAERGQGVRIAISATAAAEDVLAGRIHFTPDMSAESSFAAERALYGAGFRSRITLPLRVGERIVGALNLVWPYVNGYAAANTSLLSQTADAVALAIEKSRWFEETRHRDAILEALAYASERLLMPGDLATALPDLLAELGRAAGVSRVYIFKNHRSEAGALLASKQYEWAAPGQPDLMDDQINRNFDYVAQGFGRWVDTLGGGQPLAGVVRGFPPAERAHLQSENIRSLVMAPIFSGGEWWGLLGFDECEHERNWLTAEIEALKNVAGALGAAFARQFSESAEREQRALAEALRDTAAALNSTLNFDEVLDRILANVGKVVPHTTSSVLLIESGVGRIARCRGFAERGQEETVLRLRFPVAGLLKLQRMVETGQPLAVADVRSYPGWIDVPETRWISSHTSALIRVKGQVIGMLNLDSDTPGFFTESHARRLQVFADQAAIAIENAQLYDELSALYRASSDLINPGDDVRSLAQHIAEIVTREFPFAHCGVLVTDEAQTKLIVTGHIGLNINISVEYVPLDGPGLTVAAFKSGQSIYVPDTSADRRYLAAHAATRSEYVAPLRAGADTIGVLDMQSTELDAFDERTRRIVAAFAQHAALALENAQLLARIDQARRAAEEASHFKSEFLANTSHELRTPLTGIIGSLSAVIDDLCDSRDEEREFIQIAYTASQRLLFIINDVLDIAKIEAGKIDLQPQTVDIGQIFGEVQALTRLQAEEKKLRLEFIPPSDSPSTVWADPDRLRQILLNLVGNAIKFTEQGEVVVSVGVEARELRFSVRDTGIGVPLDKQHKLFQPFVQADGSMTRKYGGTGLGLSISRRLAELMGGDLTLQSEGEGRGSEFILTLPMSNLTGFA